MKAPDHIWYIYFEQNHPFPGGLLKGKSKLNLLEKVKFSACKANMWFIKDSLNLITLEFTHRTRCQLHNIWYDLKIGNIKCKNERISKRFIIYLFLHRWICKYPIAPDGLVFWHCEIIGISDKKISFLHYSFFMSFPSIILSRLEYFFFTLSH